MSRQKWHLLRSGRGSAAENMAVDEALLLAVRDIGGPVLRFYGWSESAASFGYFQKYTEVEHMTELRPLVRRPTGGGLVPHDADWTYSLVFSPDHEWHQLNAVESYRRVHAWIQAAFERIGCSTQLASGARKETPGQCFFGAEKFDVLLRNQKIAGAAQRRNKCGLLIQGSIQPPQGLKRADWETAFCELGGQSWSKFERPAGLDDRVRELIRTKYGQPEYNHRR